MLRVVGRKETLLDLDEEAKRHAAAKVGFRDDEIGQARRGEGVGMVGGGSCVGDVVDQVLVVGIGELLRGVVGDLGEDDGGEAASSRCCRDGMFGENGVLVRDAGIEERCCWGG